MLRLCLHEDVFVLNLTPTTCAERFRWVIAATTFQKIRDESRMASIHYTTGLAIYPNEVYFIILLHVFRIL
jgi:hypothetical protein